MSFDSSMWAVSLLVVLMGSFVACVPCMAMRILNLDVPPGEVHSLGEAIFFTFSLIIYHYNKENTETETVTTKMWRDTETGKVNTKIWTDTETGTVTTKYKETQRQEKLIQKYGQTQIKSQIYINIF